MIAAPLLESGCYKYIGSADYTAPWILAAGDEARKPRATITRERVYLACFSDPKNAEYVFVVAADPQRPDLLLKIRRDGSVGSKGGWYTPYLPGIAAPDAYVRIFQRSWTTQVLMTPAREEIAYEGIDGTTLHISYRATPDTKAERTEARHVYSYDLAAGDTIMVKNYCFKILNAEKAHVRFLVVACAVPPK
jgi:hypothetical protein